MVYWIFSKLFLNSRKKLSCYFKRKCYHVFVKKKKITVHSHHCSPHESWKNRKQYMQTKCLLASSKIRSFIWQNKKQINDLWITSYLRRWWRHWDQSDVKICAIKSYISHWHRTSLFQSVRPFCILFVLRWIHISLWCYLIVKWLSSGGK